MGAFSLDSIGIEYEFVVHNGIDNCLGECSKYISEVNKANKDFVITIDREYYDNQIEFKLYRTTNIEEGIAHFQSTMKGMYNVVSKINSTTDSHFVGTHIHMFLNKNGEPYTKFARGKKIPMVKWAYGEMAKFLQGLRGSGVRSSIIKNEMRRLTKNHNILRYFDNQIGNVLKANLEATRDSYQQFHNGTDRPKYSPVLWSLANESTGKPHSLELRCIPNSFLMLSKPASVVSYIQGIINILNTANTTTVEEDVISISSAHLGLLTTLHNI